MDETLLAEARQAQERLIDAETGMQFADSPNDLRLRLRGLV